MNGNVVLITGGTSGIGATVAKKLALSGAQVILLVRSISDGWVVDYVNELREECNNNLIFAEECNLSSLISVRKFATKWIDNTTPRRIDAIFLLAGICLPPGSPKSTTSDGLEVHYQVNYVSNALLVQLLAPVLAAQPNNRNVRIIFATCLSHVFGDCPTLDPEYKTSPYPSLNVLRCYGMSKLALMMFFYNFQQDLTSSSKTNVKCIAVNPGVVKSPMTRRFISCGSLLGLLLYIITWPIWFLILKNLGMASESVFQALNDPNIAEASNLTYIKECKSIPYSRSDVSNPEKITELLNSTKKAIDTVEMGYKKQK